MLYYTSRLIVLCKSKVDRTMLNSGQIAKECDATKVPLLTTFPASWYLPEIMFAGNLIFNFFLPVK